MLKLLDFCTDASRLRAFALDAVEAVVLFVSAVAQVAELFCSGDIGMDALYAKKDELMTDKYGKTANSPRQQDTRQPARYRDG